MKSRLVRDSCQISKGWAGIPGWPCGAKYAHKKVKQKGAILLRATNDETKQKPTEKQKQSSKKFMNFLCRRVKDAKREKNIKKLKKSKTDTELYPKTSGERGFPVTYKHTSVRLKIALLQLDYKNARQRTPHNKKDEQKWANKTKALKRKTGKFACHKNKHKDLPRTK